MLYIHDGWHIIELARKYDIHHTSVIHHVQHLQRVNPARPLPKWAKTYEDYLAEEQRRREKQRLTCGHDHIVIICTHCGQHFEETKHRSALARIVFI